MKLSYFIVAAAAVFAGPASAQFHTWVGGSGSNWSTQANWDPIALPVSSADTTLTFPRISTNNNLPGTFSTRFLFIDAASGGPMTFSGNPIRFAANVSILADIFSEPLTTPLTVRFNNQIEVAGNMLISRSNDVRYEFNRPFLAGSNAITMQSGSSVSFFAANNSAGRFELLGGSPLIVGSGSSTFINPPTIRFSDGVFRSAGGLPKIQNIEFLASPLIPAKAVFEPIFFGTSVELIGNISLTDGDATLTGPITLPIGPHGISGDVPGRSLTITSPVDGPGSFIINSTNVTFSDNALGTAKHTYTGVTTLLSSASLTVTQNSVMSPSTSMFLDIPSSFNIAGTTQKIGDILALGSVNFSNGSLDVGSAVTPIGSQMTGPVTAINARLIKSGTRDFRFAPTTLTTTDNSLTLQVDSGQLITTLPPGVGLLEIAPNATANIEVATTNTYTGLIKGTPAGPGNLEKTGPGLLILRPEIAETIQIANLTILAGQVATTDNSLIINYTTTSPISTLISYILSGTLLASSDFAGLPTYLAIAESSDLGLTSFNGIAIDSTTVIAKYTYVGDANLDGQVDALDYERIDLAIGNTGVLGTAQGDLNYDGFVDALDYEQVDLNIGNGVGSPLGTTGPASVFIPEPAALAPVALAALATRRRR